MESPSGNIELDSLAFLQMLVQMLIGTYVEARKPANFHIWSAQSLAMLMSDFL